MKPTISNGVIPNDVPPFRYKRRLVRSRLLFPPLPAVRVGPYAATWANVGACVPALGSVRPSCASSPRRASGWVGVVGLAWWPALRPLPLSSRAFRPAPAAPRWAWAAPAGPGALPRPACPRSWCPSRALVPSLPPRGGGGERTRTADFHVANVALYQLSYTPGGNQAPG